MLSPEDKQRIEAEEAYRAQVRNGSRYMGSAWMGVGLAVVAAGGFVAGTYSSGRSATGTSKSSASEHNKSQTTAPPNRVVDRVIQDTHEATKNRNLEHFKRMAGEDPSSSPVPAPSAPMRERFQDRQTDITRGQITIGARRYVTFRVRIDDSMYNPHVIGRFHASGGSGNDIQVAVVHEDELPNLTNGHSARVLWSTKGKKTTDSFDVALSPGTYYLWVSNQFSEFTAKQVFLDATLEWRVYSP